MLGPPPFPTHPCRNGGWDPGPWTLNHPHTCPLEGTLSPLLGLQGFGAAMPHASSAQGLTPQPWSLAGVHPCS